MWDGWCSRGGDPGPLGFAPLPPSALCPRGSGSRASDPTQLEPRCCREGILCVRLVRGQLTEVPLTLEELGGPPHQLKDRGRSRVFPEGGESLPLSAAACASRPPARQLSGLLVPPPQGNPAESSQAHTHAPAFRCLGTRLLLRFIGQHVGWGAFDCQGRVAAMPPSSKPQRTFNSKGAGKCSLAPARWRRSYCRCRRLKPHTGILSPPLWARGRARLTWVLYSRPRRAAASSGAQGPVAVVGVPPHRRWSPRDAPSGSARETAA